MNAITTAKTVTEAIDRFTEMKKRKNATTAEMVGIGNWKAIQVGGFRPLQAAGECFSGEEKSMIAMNPIQDPWERLATVAERYMDFLEKGFRADEWDKEHHDKKPLTPLEASEILRLHVQTVMKLCRQRKLEAYKIGGNELNGKGGKYVIPREAVDAYIAKQRLIYGSRKGGVK